MPPSAVDIAMLIAWQGCDKTKSEFFYSFNDRVQGAEAAARRLLRLPCNAMLRGTLSHGGASDRRLRKTAI
jgi:hypothetical protein